MEVVRFSVRRRYVDVWNIYGRSLQCERSERVFHYFSLFHYSLNYEQVLFDLGRVQIYCMRALKQHQVGFKIHNGFRSIETQTRAGRFAGHTFKNA